MIEVDAELERADKARRARERAQKQRLQWVAAIALSYAVDTVFLALYVSAGTIPGYVPVAYCAIGLAFCLAYAALVALGANLRLRDPSALTPSVLWGVVAQLAVVAMAPQITFPFLVNLFTVFAFGMLWLPLRGAAVVWTLGMVGTGAVMYLGEGRIGAAASNNFELTLSWLFLSVILSRSLMLTVYANGLRARLADNRRKLAASLAKIQELVHYDELTGAFNRRALVARLGEELSRSTRTHVPFSVALLDLDHFKAVNDSYGHTAGDQVLRAFAATVRAQMRKTDVFGRYGGEEFLMILTGSNSALAVAAMERVRAAVAARDWGDIAPGLMLSVSVGLASYRKDDTAEQLINRADAALYAAKGRGRNQIVTAD